MQTEQNGKDVASGQSLSNDGLAVNVTTTKGNKMGKCELCGEPMPEGEEMFKFHGYSGDCPRPPLPRDYGIEGVKKFFKDATGVDVDVRVDNEEFIVIDPDGQEFRSGLVRKQ